MPKSVADVPAAPVVYMRFEIVSQVTVPLLETRMTGSESVSGLADETRGRFHI
jgi:hypothetical protein